MALISVILLGATSTFSGEVAAQVTLNDQSMIMKR